MAAVANAAGGGALLLPSPLWILLDLRLTGVGCLTWRRPGTCRCEMPPGDRSGPAEHHHPGANGCDCTLGRGRARNQLRRRRCRGRARDAPHREHDTGRLLRTPDAVSIDVTGRSEGVGVESSCKRAERGRRALRGLSSVGTRTGIGDARRRVGTVSRRGRRRPVPDQKRPALRTDEGGARGR